METYWTLRVDDHLFNYVIDHLKRSSKLKYINDHQGIILVSSHGIISFDDMYQATGVSPKFISMKDYNRFYKIEDSPLIIEMLQEAMPGINIRQIDDNNLLVDMLGQIYDFYGIINYLSMHEVGYDLEPVPYIPDNYIMYGRDFSNLYPSGVLSDIEIMIEYGDNNILRVKYFKVHKAILAGASDYFFSYFSNFSPNGQMVELKDVDPNIFKLFFRLHLWIKGDD